MIMLVFGVEKVTIFILKIVHDLLDVNAKDIWFADENEVNLSYLHKMFQIKQIPFDPLQVPSQELQ